MADARVHDLRHSHASPDAVMNGESLHVAGRLFGNRAPALPTGASISTKQASERIAIAIERNCEPSNGGAAEPLIRYSESRREQYGRSTRMGGPIGARQ